MAKKKTKKKDGRPTGYNKGRVKQVKEYLDSCQDIEVQLIKQVNEKKGYQMYENKLKVNLPTIEGLAYTLDVSRSTIYLWKEDHKEFSDILEKLLAKQAFLLINNGISGAYNSTITKLMMTKHDYRDSQEHTGKGGKNLFPSSVEDLTNEQLEKLIAEADES